MNLKRVLSKLPTGFADEAAGFDAKRLRSEIVQAEGVIHETEQEREADEKLQGAKDLVRDLGSGYSDVIKAQRAKVSYCVHLLEERGEPANGRG